MPDKPPFCLICEVEMRLDSFGIEQQTEIRIYRCPRCGRKGREWSVFDFPKPMEGPE